MAVFRVEKSKDYTVMSNHHLRNSDLSLRAKGLLSQILSLPENWDYTIAGLAAINKEGKDAVRAAVQELEKAGYIERRQTMSAGGQFSGNEYVVHEEPVSASPLSGFPTTVKPTTEKPSTEKPLTAEPLTENPTELNIDISSKDISKRKIKKEKVEPLNDETLNNLFIDWIRIVSGEEWTNWERNAVFLALGRFYAPREKAKQNPARSEAGFTALAGRLVRLSGGNPGLMVEMLDIATTSLWKSVFPLNRQAAESPESSPDKEEEEWLN